MRILILGQVWPEPTSSAAGYRMMQLIEAFQLQGWEVHFASAATPSLHAVNLEVMHIGQTNINLNDASFDTYLIDLNPHLVLFDRFMIEEQYGWRVAKYAPHAMRVLDTEDLHGLRKGRELAHTKKRECTKQDLINPYAQREIASIYRCDLSLIISEYEMQLLNTLYKVPQELLLYLPFMVDQVGEEFKLSYEDKNDFVSIGNFRHTPNWDAVCYLKEDLWPKIKTNLPQAKLFIYGSYASAKVNQLHNPKQGFFIMGRAITAQEVIASARLLLAPLRIGAGLKGKLLDAMQYGTPSITTSIGAEGMHNNLTWNGFIADSPDEFVEAAIELYTHKEQWNAARQKGTQLISKRFLKKKWMPVFIEAILNVKNNLNDHRIQNFTGMMLQHQSLQATKYMSRWIEEKNKNK